MINSTVLITGDSSNGPITVIEGRQVGSSFKVFTVPGVIIFTALGPCPPSTNPPP